MTLIRFAAGNKPTSLPRLAELVGKMEVMTTDGDTTQLIGNDIGDVYDWLLWVQDSIQSKEQNNAK